jgi:hypothetical protein
MAPHLDRWHTTWKDRGLRVVKVEDGRATTLDELQAWVRSEGTKYPVVHDAGGVLMGRFGVTRYPTALLVDRGGTILWKGYPSLDPAGVEAEIERALR